MDWIPYIIVLGEREVAEQCLNVRTRNGSQRKMTLPELLAGVETQMQGKPFLGLPLPQLLSKRPIFVG